MPVKARRAKSRAHAITPAAVQAFIADDYFALHQALGLKPWNVSPLHVREDSVCVHPPGTGYADSWDLVLRLRAELEAAVAERR